MSYLQVADLSVKYLQPYKVVNALQGVSMSIDSGEIVAVLGKTGSGKTTLIRSILAMLPKTGQLGGSSKITLASNDLQDLNEKQIRKLRREDIRIISQNPYLSLNPTMRCGKQIELMMSGSKAKKREQIFRSLAQVGIEDPNRVARSYPHQLSLGQCQRVNVAMALTGHPKLILADEPTSSLNMEVIDLVVKQLRKQASEGAAVLLISHDLAVVQKMADRWYFLEEGCFVAEGTGSLDDYDGSNPAIRHLTAHRQTLEEAKPMWSTEASTLMKLKDVSFTYRDTWGRKSPMVSLPSLEVKAESCVGISGPSGCGKSTILKLMAGLEQDYLGTITYRGAEVSDLIQSNARQFHSEVQYIFQDAAAALPPRMSIRQILLRTLKNNGVERQRRVEHMHQILRQCQLEEGLLESKKGQLSGGQQQRVALARALCVRPQVILFDESLASLDLPIQMELLKTIEDLIVEAKLTAVLVSHRRDLLQAVCSEIVDM